MTGGHPFYVVGMGFILAKNLKANEKLLLSDGKEVIIEKIEVETLTQAETTYNFEVADFHTYYVSDSKVLVHNMCHTPDQKALTEIIKENGKNNPLSMKDAETLVDWGKEYGMDVHIDMGHSFGSEVSRGPHLHTGFNGWHIPIILP